MGRIICVRPRNATVAGVPWNGFGVWFDLLNLRLRLPAEGVQTCLALTLMLAFALGVASVGALYRGMKLRAEQGRARPPAADGAEREGPPELDLGPTPANALMLVVDLLHYAVFGSRRG